MGSARVSPRGLLDAATAVLASNPGATLEEVARAAKLSRATLYRAFSSREALLRAAALDALESVEAGLKPIPLERGDPLDVIERIAHVLVPLGAKFHFLAAEDWLEQDRKVAARLEKLERAVGGVFERARGAGLLDAGIPVEWQLRAFFALVYAGWECVGEQIFVPRDAVRAVVSAFLGGQRARSAAVTRQPARRAVRARRPGREP